MATKEQVKKTAPKVERSIVVPPNRRRPVKNFWGKISELLVNQLKLQIRILTKCTPWRVELRSAPSVGADTEAETKLQRAANFLEAFMNGFELDDARALLRMEGLYVETFNITDVKQSLKGDHLARGVGRICGSNGRTKHAIENATKTRIVVADKTIHILGSFENIHLARRSLCDLILGAPPNKVYGRLRTKATNFASSL